MELFRDILIFVSLFLGLFFFGVGVVGLLRLPDVYCRMHATTKCDTLGGELILVALILHYGMTAASVRLIIMIIFIWITSPTAAQVIAKAAYRNDYPMVDGSFERDCTKEGAK